MSTPQGPESDDAQSRPRPSDASATDSRPVNGKPDGRESTPFDVGWTLAMIVAGVFILALLLWGLGWALVKVYGSIDLPQDETLITLLIKLITHVVLIVSVVGQLAYLAYLTWHDPDRQRPPVLERCIRLSAYSTGVLIAYGSKALGLSVPEFLTDSLKATNPTTVGIFGVILPGAIGVLIAWYVRRSLRDSHDIAGRRA